jgi:DNA-binding GntR family transcriptional regulator
MTVLDGGDGAARRRIPHPSKPHSPGKQRSRSVEQRKLEDLIATLRPTHASIYSLVVAVLRQAILDGILPPRTRLRQVELASIFSTSRIPVHEALRLLEHEGLLESEPNRGFSVKPMGADEIDEIYDLRIALECHAVQLAVPLLTDSDLSELTELYEAMEAERDHDERRVRREQFYRRLFSVPARPRLLQLIMTMHRELARSLRWYAVPHSEEHHREFFDAVRRRDEEAAERLLTTHYRKVAALLRRFIREEELAEPGGPSGEARPRGVHRRRGRPPTEVSRVAIDR